MSSAPARLSAFARYAWGVLAYNVAVVLWGAYVRATGSGAGCGRHWPHCDGKVIPRLASTEQVIEFTHRVTSGIALLLVVGLLVWAFRGHRRGHPARRGAVASMVLMVIEALLGAGLVLLALVAGNSSGLRAFSMAAHLANTFLLLGALTLTAWWGSGGAPVRLRGQGPVAGWALAGLGAVIAVGITGAIAALGDTLFPARSLAEGFRQDLDPTAHFLVQVRSVHPFLAIATGALVVWLGRYLRARRPSPTTRRLSVALGGLYGAQIVAGVVNLVLLVPIGMQMVHLLMADAVWITLVLTCAAALGDPGHSGAPAPHAEGEPVERAPALT